MGWLKSIFGRARTGTSDSQKTCTIPPVGEEDDKTTSLSDSQKAILMSHLRKEFGFRDSCEMLKNKQVNFLKRSEISQQRKAFKKQKKKEKQAATEKQTAQSKIIEMESDGEAPIIQIPTPHTFIHTPTHTFTGLSPKQKKMADEIEESFRQMKQEIASLKLQDMINKN